MDISNLIQSLFGSPAPAPSPSIFVDDATRQRVTQDALSRARQLQGVPPALMPVSVPTNQQAQSQLASVPPDLVQRAQPKTYSLGSTEPGSLRYALGSLMGLHPPADNMLASQPAPQTAMLAQAEQPSPLAAAPAENVTSMPLPATTLPAGAPPIDTNPMPPQTPQVAQSSDPWSGERQTDPWAGLREVTAPNTDPVTTASTASPQAALSSAAAASPSLWDKYQNFTRSDRGRALNAFFTGLAMGKTPQESLAYGARMVAATGNERRKRDRTNQTAKWLQERGLSADDASLLASNPTALADYLKNALNPGAGQTSDIKNYQFAVQNGYKGNFAQWQKDKNPGVSVNLPGAPNIGSIPPGYAAKQDAQGNWTMQPIPGGPAAEKLQDAANVKTKQAEAASTATNTINTAAEAARKLISPYTTGVTGAALGKIPDTDAAELRRQIDVLRSTASVTTLNAMRQQSKTGGALGSVTEREEQMLANTLGAINANSSPEQLKTALDNYQHTLLRIVNGPEEGDRLWTEMQAKNKAASQSGWTDLGNGVKVRKLP